MMLRHATLFVLALWVLCSCKPSLPSHVLSPSDMEDILVDLHLAQGMAELHTFTSDDRYLLAHSVFRKHRVTEEEFDSSMVWYSGHCEKLAEIYERVDLRIQARVAQSSSDNQPQQNKYALLAADGDTCNVWTLSTHANLLPDRWNNIYQFTLKADSTYLPGDDFVWYLHTDYKQQNGGQRAIAHLAVTYANDTVVCRTENLNALADVEIKVESTEEVDTLDIKQISGFVYFPLRGRGTSENFNMLMLSDMALIRMHKELPDTTVVETDSTAVEQDVDTLELPNERLTPMQRRDAKPHQSTINVQKLRPIRRQTRTNVRR